MVAVAHELHDEEALATPHHPSSRGLAVENAQVELYDDLLAVDPHRLEIAGAVHRVLIDGPLVERHLPPKSAHGPGRCQGMMESWGMMIA